MRTSSEPARARSISWRAVASASAVSVLVIDWTATGRPPPTATEPIRTRVDVMAPSLARPACYPRKHELAGSRHVRLHREAIRPGKPDPLAGFSPRVAPRDG